MKTPAHFVLELSSNRVLEVPPPPPPPPHADTGLHDDYLTGLATVDFTLLVDSFFWGSTLNHAVALSNSFHAPCMPHPMISQSPVNVQPMLSQSPAYAQPMPSLCSPYAQPISSLCSAKAQPMLGQSPAYAQPMSSLRSANAQPVLYCLRCPANA